MTTLKEEMDLVLYEVDETAWKIQMPELIRKTKRDGPWQGWQR